MPAGGHYGGVWFSPQYGEMEVVQSGNQVVGTYVKNERAGRFQGNATGNLLRFTWTEDRELVPGRPTVAEGRGYFKYVIGEDGKHYLVGEWGYDDNEVGGGEWRAYKLRHKKARLGQGSADGEDNSADEARESADKAVEDVTSEDAQEEE